MFGTIVVKMCDCAMDLVGPMPSAAADRAYWFCWKVRYAALGLNAGGDTVKRPCWYCVVGAKNPNDPEDMSCRYCLSGEPNPEAERYRQKEGRSCWHCEVGAKHPEDVVPIQGCEKDLLADSPGIPPEKLDNGRCGCDWPRVSTLPCGDCSCRCECDEETDRCAVNLIWKRLTEGEQESWCGCAEPGKEVLACGHCGCRNGLCWEFVNVDPDQPFEKRRKADCA